MTTNFVSEYPTMELSTLELAKLILSRPSIIHSFSPVMPDGVFFYDIVCERILEPQSVIISDCYMFGEVAFMFNLPDYQEGIHTDKPVIQPEECLNDMLRGLRRFSERYCDNADKWLVKDGDLIRIEINYKKIK